MDNISPITPKTRYSCSSEYATPKGSDDSDSSMYYSFVLSEDDGPMNKENTVNSDHWTETDSNSPIVSSKNVTSNARPKTPLLRKVLRSNFTPRNENNKRVSFYDLQKQSPTSGATPVVKISKIFSNGLKKQSIDNMVLPATTTANTNSTFDLKPIEESLQLTSNEKIVETLSHEKKMADGNVDEDVMINDSASDITDDLEYDLHDTIIENPSTVNKGIYEATPTCPLVSQLLRHKLTTPPAKTSKTTETGSIPQQVTISNSTWVKNLIPPISKANAATNIKTFEEVLRVAQNSVQSRNTTKMDRQRLVIESRKSILPVAKKTTRSTSYKRRSSMYEPRKANPRKSLNVLKQVAHHVNKPIEARKGRTASISHLASSSSKHTSTNMTSKTNLSSKMSAPKTVATKTIPLSKTHISKPRLTSQPPRVSIVSTHQSISGNASAQRRETKFSPTSLAVPKALKPITSHVSVDSSVASIKPQSIKPSVCGKCQYCDKFFAKTYGMMTHLLEKCEKIPASARRQLLEKEKNNDESNSKQRKTQASRQDTDFLSKYSRLFVNLTNEGASGMQNNGIATNGLKYLKAELRKVKGAHTGITRTPSKPIRCHLCKKIFYDCIEYADHSTNHPPDCTYILANSNVVSHLQTNV